MSNLELEAKRKYSRQPHRYCPRTSGTSSTILINDGCSKRVVVRKGYPMSGNSGSPKISFVIGRIGLDLLTDFGSSKVPCQPWLQRKTCV
ncbi:hypothetical protein IAQ61_004852 [Plenodomus lingam]|uniref:uncharacterized protein n=1 Tax=Leptosphaeria maculans TaxID=5022 RepID=UPI003316FE5E|nr:hypothetical protein IAQ61_004852 [Plenodomus lingam]